MSYATIMVHARASADGEARLRLAADLAKRFEAMLIGVSAGTISAPVTSPCGEGLAFDLIEMQEQDIKEEMTAAERSFRSIAQLSGGELAWISEMDFPNLVLARESRAADVVILGRNPPSLGSNSYRSPDPGDVLMRVGRPVLVVPPGIDHLEASRIVIAWKDTREARRAITDSLPFLKRASSVHVVAICDSEDEESASRNSLAAIVTYLHRHGVENHSEARLLREASVQAELPLAAERHQADLLVAGGYGHTRLQEWIFGGVTRALINHFPKCCLLSH